MARRMAQFVDPQVSKAKFDREVADFHASARDYRERGWILLDAAFPQVLVAMAAPQLTPPAIVTGVLLDYTNYDAEPPSVRLVDPFTQQPYPPDGLPTVLKRSVEASIGEGVIPPGVQLPAGGQLRVEQPLVQWHEGGVPFLCIAGVREYHEHPGHTGDAWELHRAAGAGRIVRLLEIIDKYGVQPITEFGVQLVPQVAGFRQGQPPA
jgi:Predicted metal binding domain